MSHAARSHIVRALPGFWCSMAAHLVSGAPGSIIWLRFYLPCCWGRQQDSNLRTLNVTTAAEPAQLCLHIGSRLRFAFSSAAHCFCGLTVRRCGHSLCALNFSRFLARLCGWYGIAVLPCFSASRKLPVTRCGLPLRSTYAEYGAFSFGFRLSALRNTHNPSELHGKRMAERLPFQCSGTLSGGTLCHLPTVVPHLFFRRGFRLYRLRIAQPFSMCRHTSGPDGRRDLPPLIVGQLTQSGVYPSYTAGG